MTTGAVALAEVTRRDEVTGRELVESRHRGHLVVTVDGELAFAAGDAERATFLRSSVKPIQAQACLELLAEHGWPGGQPTSREVAVAWSSHRGEPDHLAVVEDLCGRAGIAPDQLTCPPDRTEDGAAADRRRIHHNCSGKHALFALAGVALGVRGPALLDRDGPLQRPLLARLARELGGVDAVGVDGCGAPAVRAPLVGLAHFFARLAADPDWSTVRGAGLSHPDLVGGRGRLETAALARGVVAKLGAEGVYAAGFVQDGRRVGLAVKCEDGAMRAAAAGMLGALAAWGRAPDGWQVPPPLGADLPVGEVRCDPDLQASLAAVV